MQNSQCQTPLGSPQTSLSQASDFYTFKPLHIIPHLYRTPQQVSEIRVLILFLAFLLIFTRALLILEFLWADGKRIGMEGVLFSLNFILFDISMGGILPFCIVFEGVSCNKTEVKYKPSCLYFEFTHSLTRTTFRYGNW